MKVEFMTNKIKEQKKNPKLYWYVSNEKYRFMNAYMTIRY